MKLVGGTLGGSVALLSDAAHSLVDAVISAALLFAFIIAQRPADPEHPYGHGRVESLAGQVVSLILIGLAIAIGLGAVASLSRPYRPPELFTLAVAAAGAIIQEFLYHSTSRVARRSGSSALLGMAWDYRLDALGSLAALVGVALARSGGPSWHWADHGAAVIVAATIFSVGVHLLWENTQGLMDRQASTEQLDLVRAAATDVSGVVGIETLRMRKAGLEYLVDIHVEVEPSLSVREGHVIAHCVKARLMSDFPPIRDVLVHIEPSYEPEGSR
jgi:cation diffusion facilitator family transporter